ncbi:hypothetical protein HK105_209347 [Polyrhizophydium stewartii]|uniref:COX assembly mitochondrial protein n=1 Tax=Polyrhizophydium stewartii TaxID=2732419 RepID=A0ABR4MVB7_9FUNG|nr:hypothetical protein HK105_006733 [Polyrhizophydium stewartii]
MPTVDRDDAGAGAPARAATPSGQGAPPGSLPPTRDARKRCWAARDAYFSCLDANGLWLHGLAPTQYDEIVRIDPTRPPVASESDRSLSREQRAKLFTCANAKAFYESECLGSWSVHFAMLRVKEMQSKHLAEKIRQDHEERFKNKDEFWARVKKN